jgi:hypothetical protein
VKLLTFTSQENGPPYSFPLSTFFATTLSHPSLLFHSSSWTNRILSAQDFGSVQVIYFSRSCCGLILMLAAFQINVADIDPITGVSTKSYTAFALSGFVRGHVSALPLSPCLCVSLSSQGEGDEALTALVAKNDAQ